MWHLTDQQVAALFNSEQDRQANREAVRHLLTGCSHCCRKVNSFIEQANEKLERATRHLPRPRRSKTCLDM